MIQLQSDTTSLFLLDWFEFWIYIQPVGDHARGNLGHIFVSPGKARTLYSQEYDRPWSWCLIVTW